MALPTYQDLYPDLLSVVRDRKEYSMREVRERLATALEVSKQDLEELLPSGRQRVFESRVGWAKTYLVKAGLLQQPRRGIIQITDRGIEALKLPRESVDNGLLKQYSEFNDFYQRGNGADEEIGRAHV